MTRRRRPHEKDRSDALDRSPRHTRRGADRGDARRRAEAEAAIADSEVGARYLRIAVRSAPDTMARPAGHFSPGGAKTGMTRARRLRDLTAVLLIAAVYFVAAKLGLKLA